ncbi:MAG: hypothetical protein MUP66_03305 [Candidatus Nanohaloarchaeota archaeon QJJ-5]|nr:hypothetical protein [Candidatus Nanohaloarchaeota archaeon QJJ-5]
MIDDHDLAVTGFYERTRYLESFIKEHDPPKEAVETEIEAIASLYSTIGSDTNPRYRDACTRLETIEPILEHDYDIEIWDELEADTTSESPRFEFGERLLSTYDRLSSIYRRYLGHGTGDLGDAAYRMPKE